MDNQEILDKLNAAEKEITRFLMVIGSGSNDDEIQYQLQKLDLQNRIENMNNWNYCTVRIVPLLLKIIMNKRMRNYPQLLKPIIILLGNLKPDGFISEYAFFEIVKDTPFSKEEIFEDLKSRGYVENHKLSPKFKPLDTNFHFDMDPRFSELKENILETMLSIPKSTPAANALIALLRDQSLKSLHPDIIRALQQTGHPVAVPVLLELAQNNHETARKALVKMALRDVEELQQLLGQGVTKDVWGNELKEKVFVFIRELLPFLLEALQSEEYSLKEKKLVCYLFHEMGVHRRSDMEIFAHVLPVVYEEQVEDCYVTKVLVAGGRMAVSHICSVMADVSGGEGVLRRFLFILGEIGPDAEEAVPCLQRLKEENNPLSGYIAEILDKIRPAAEKKPDTDETSGITMDEAQKETIDADPGDYVLY